MYAKFVRSFAMYGGGNNDSKMEPSTYYQIQASRKFRTLFPNLIEIYCHGRWEDVYFLLSPSLRQVVILDNQNSRSFSSSISTFVNTLSKICPDIQSLEVYVDISISALRSVQKLQKLQYLGLNLLGAQADDEHITGLSLLPNLRILKFSTPRWWEPLRWKSLPIFKSPESFCALQQLDFFASLGRIVNNLPSFISPNLTSFNAEIIDAWAEEDCTIPAERLCHQLCDILAKHPRSPLSSLRTLSFISRTSDFLPTEAFQLL